MKKILLFLGLVLVIVAAVVIGSIVTKQKESAKYVTTAVPYVKQVIPEISKWDPAIIKSYMPVESLEKTSDERIVAIVNNLSKLGSLESVAEPEFERMFYSTSVDTGKKKLVAYSVDAEYTNSPAKVAITLLVIGDTFQVAKFDIEAELLKQQL